MISAGTQDESPDPLQTLAPETRPVQIAEASADDVVSGDSNGLVSAESVPDFSHALAPETSTDAKQGVTSTETHDECLEREVCIDQYLWSVYQRAPKEDTIKVVDRRKVIVNIMASHRPSSRNLQRSSMRTSRGRIPRRLKKLACH